MQRFLFLDLPGIAAAARAEPVGEVDTVFKLIGPDHKIVVSGRKRCSANAFR